MQPTSLAAPATTAGPSRLRGTAATVLTVTVPPVLLAAVGLSHPAELTAGSAQWWTTMHTLLLLVFPLLGVAHWVLLRNVPGPLAWVGRVAAFAYIAGYGALDAIGGIAAGTVMQRSGAAVATDRPEIAWIFAAGNEVGTIGAWAFLVASVATSLALLRTGGRWAAVGGPVLVLACVPFLDSHIYWPTGGLTMLAIAAGLGLLAVARHQEPMPGSRAQEQD
jgi:hypothetical protein